MLAHNLSDNDLEDIEFVWANSSEGELLVDYSKKHKRECFEVLKFLAKSRNPEVRWQVYEALDDSSKKEIILLRGGLNDKDPYCRRRAVLCLARTFPPDAKSLAERFLKDEDPYMRLAALELVRASKDQKFIKDVKSRMLQDPIDYVRREAKTLK